MGAIEAKITTAERWYIGEDRTINIDVNQADGTTAQTMTGWALTWELYDGEGGAVLLTKTTAAGGVVIGNGDGTDDRAAVTIADGDTEALSPGTYFHLLRRTDGGSEHVLAYGDAILLTSGFS